MAHTKPEEEEKPNIVEYSSIVNNLGYKKETVDSSEVTGRVIHEDGPYVIEEENYGEFSDYDTLTLIYYADGFLADEEGNLVDDAGKKVDLSSETPLATIPVYKDDGITLYENAKSPKQNRLAVYANIYPTKESGADPKKVTIGCGTLKGKWEYCGDYKEVGVDED